jgi:hypothetical protein
MPAALPFGTFLRLNHNGPEGTRIPQGECYEQHLHDVQKPGRGEWAEGWDRSKGARREPRLGRAVETGRADSGRVPGRPDLGPVGGVVGQEVRQDATSVVAVVAAQDSELHQQRRVVPRGSFFTQRTDERQGPNSIVLSGNSTATVNGGRSSGRVYLTDKSPSGHD